MFSKLTSFINPYTMYLKIGLLVIVAIYIGWLNIQKGRFEGKAIKFEAESNAKSLEINAWAESSKTLQASVENQNKALEALVLANKSAQFKATAAIKKAQSIVQARRAQINQATNNGVLPKTCDSAVEKAMRDLRGSAL